MSRSQEQLARAAADTAAWLDSLDPAAVAADNPADLRRIGLALDDVATGEQELADAVGGARDNGRSWAEIGLALGVSRQAARQRFGHPTHA